MTLRSSPAGSLPTGEGYQCADCGFYFPRNMIRDIGGEYYCQATMGHNRTRRERNAS